MRREVYKRLVRSPELPSQRPCGARYAGLGLGQLLVNEGRELGFVEGAHLGGGQLPVFEQHQCGDATDTEFGGHLAVFIYIEFGHGEFALVALGDVVKDRRYHAAWATPFSPKINQHRGAGLHHVLLKFGVGGVADEIAGHEKFLFETIGCVKASIVTETVCQGASAWHWHASLQPLAQRLQQHGTPPWRAVLLLPFAQLIPQARAAWQSHWPGPVPRMETATTWARRLAPWRALADDFAGHAARDVLVAQSMWRRLGFVQRRGPWATGMADVLRQNAGVLSPLAQAQAPDQRSAWAERVTRALHSGWVGQTQHWEGALWATAAAWVGHSRCATDVLWAPSTREQTDWLAVLPGDSSPLPQALLQHWAERGLALPALEPVAMDGAPRVTACHDLAHEALSAAGLVWHGLQQAGGTRVALVSQDRRVVRRAAAWLMARGVQVHDEAGWRLSTTRAGAELWALLQQEAVGWRGRQPIWVWLQRLQQAWMPVAHALGWQSDAAADQVALALGLDHPAARWQGVSDDIERPMAASVFVRWAREVLEGESFVPPRPLGEAQVVVLPMSHTLGRTFDRWVVPGCDHVSLPVAPTLPAGLSSAQRQALGLPTRGELSQRAAHTFACLTRMPQVDILWRQQQGAEALLPSPWVQRAAVVEPTSCPAAPSPGIQAQAWRATVPPAPAPSAPAQLPGSVSATSLRRLRQCPYQFFVHDVLGLHPPDEVQPLPTRRELGTWLHEVLQRFHADPRQYEAPQQQEAWLLACADGARAAHRLSDARFLPFAPLWPHLARTYLAQWQADLAQGVQCHEVEHRLRMPWQDVTLIGTMDRVDRLADGAGWRIVDYKFERKDKTRRRLAEPAEDWQAAVYTALWRHRHPNTPVTMAYLALSDSGVVQEDRPVVMVISSATPQDGEQSLAHLGDDWQRLRQGAAMPAMGRWDACTHCSARGVCRRDFRASA